MNTNHQQNLNRPTRRGFSHIDAIIVMVVVMISMILIFAFIDNSPGNTRKGRRQMPSISQIRGMHQSMIIYAQNNNTYLPGLDSSGNILAATDPSFGNVPNNTLAGGSMSSRYYILLNGSFISSNLIISPHDKLAKWSSDKTMPSDHHFSYSLLRIANSSTTTSFAEHLGRVMEWRDNANSQAILISDRNTAATADSSAVRSVWSTNTGTYAAWKGAVLWGDNHGEFLNTHHARLGILTLNTKYASTINTDDFLFSHQDMSGKVGSASAMFGYTHDNY